MGVDEGNIQVMDLEMMIENCPLTIPAVHAGRSGGSVGNLETF